MSSKDFKQSEKEKVEFKVVSEESTEGYALAPLNEPIEDSPEQPEEDPVSSPVAQEDVKANPVKGFEKLELIGSGAMGAVWKVRERSSGKVFANKYIIPELASDPNTIRRFQQEAKVAIELHHPNLAAVYGSGVDETGQPFIQMQYVEGESLAEVIAREGKLSEERAEDIFNQICEALKYLHAHGVIHRDIKPSNIIIGKTTGGADVVSVTDFGISKSIYEDVQPTHALTQTSDVLGSFLYSSPEQCLGEELTPSSDIYSLGCVFYEMLTGKPPFDEKNSVKLIMKQLSEQPDFEKVPPKFRLLFTYCLSKDPKSRARSIEKLIEINKKLEFTGSQYSSVSKIIPYSVGFVAIFASMMSGQNSDVFFVGLNACTQATCIFVIWLFVASLARMHSLKTDILKTSSSAILAALPISVIAVYSHTLEKEFSGLIFFICIFLYFGLTRYFKSADVSDRIFDMMAKNSNSNFFLNHSAKFTHNIQFAVARLTFFVGAVFAVPFILNTLLNIHDRISFSPLTPLSLGFLYVLYIYHSTATEASIGFKMRKAARFAIVNFACSLGFVLLPVAMLWSNSTASIIKYSSQLFEKVAIFRTLPQELATLPKDELGNYARIIALQKLISRWEAPELANSIADDIIESEKKSSLVKAMAYGYKDVLNRRQINDNAPASSNFEECLTELYESKSKVNFRHPKILLADLLTRNQLIDSLGDCLYYVAQEANKNGYPEEARKVLNEKKRLGISSGDFPYYFRVLEDKVND